MDRGRLEEEEGGAAVKLGIWALISGLGMTAAARRGAKPARTARPEPAAAAWTGFGWRSQEVPREPISDAERRKLGIPATLRPVAAPDVSQCSVFDPALKHYRHGYRAADPLFDDKAVGQPWYAARRAAIDAVLAAVAASPYADSLVLRGSILLRAWYGQEAREPGDLDFVVVPETWGIDEPRTAEMLDALAVAAQSTAAAGGDLRIIAQDAVSERIWTYERVPGCRLLLPWEADGLPGGWIQLDFVFNEHLPLAPEPTLVPAASGGPGALLLAATPELSLAWKILWLATDCYPQGKDLYDAVLLAEHTTLRYEVLRDAFANAEEDEYRLQVLRPRHVLDLGTEWNHFQSEYPGQPATDIHYVRRLADALAPTFATFEGRPVDEYEAHAAWLEPHIEHYRQVVGGDRSKILATLLPGQTPAVSGVVIIRELLGRDTASVDEARRVYIPDGAWETFKNNPWINRNEQLNALKAIGVDVGGAGSGDEDGDGGAEGSGDG